MDTATLIQLHTVHSSFYVAMAELSSCSRDCMWHSWLHSCSAHRNLHGTATTWRVLSAVCTTIPQHWFCFFNHVHLSCENKGGKRKVGFECHTFKSQWSVDYIVTKLDGKTLCLLCSDTIAVVKEYNIRQRFHIKLYHNISNSQKIKIRKIRKFITEYLITTISSQK